MKSHTSRKSGRPKKSAVTIERIHQAAFDLIERGGLDGLTFRVLAKELNVTPMAITHHVGNRKQLLAGLIASAFYAISNQVEGETPVIRLRSLLLRYFRTAIANANLIHLMLADTTLLGDELRRFTELVRREVEDLAEEKSRVAVFNLIIDYTHGFVCSVAAAPANEGPTEEEYLKSLDWILFKLET